MEKRFAIVLLSLVTGLGVALGDGGMFFRRATPKYADVYQPTQKVYIRWDGSQERLLIQTKYEGPAEEMVWIVPVPAEPTVARADGSVFNDLSKRTYNLAVDFTNFAVLELSGRTLSAGGSVSSTSPVEWHERIGDYDVALLRPVGGEDVIAWLNANDFATPESINPVLEDYVADGWWMVAARIHPDALSSITSEKLAKGTLHPLEMTFQSEACLFPMRLTRMAAGPVEELIYIEGPAHYEPATLTDAPWDIQLFGGPVRRVDAGYYLSDVERAVEVAEGRAQVTTSPRLTKLRRVFQPDEMTEDLIFREIDLAQWLASKDAIPLTPPTTPADRRPDPQDQIDYAPQLANSAPMRIARAATQYGRWRGPNGIAPLIDALSPEALDQVKPDPQDYLPWSLPSANFLSWGATERWSWPTTKQDWPQHPGCGHLRSCIWALGEIGVEHEIGEAAEEKLLECARHDNQLIRMEAYLALTKMRNEKLGSVLVDRITNVLSTDSLPALWWLDLWAAEAEMDIVAEWITCFGTAQQEDVFVAILRDQMASTDANSLYFVGPEQRMPFVYNWPEWIVWQAACTQDERLIPALEELRLRVPPERASSTDPFLTRAEAACGSPEAATAVVREILDAEEQILKDGQAPGTGGFVSLDNLYVWNATPSLRVQILRRRALAYLLYPTPPEVSDRTIRTALSDGGVGDWYALYLLAGIKKPQVGDKERLQRIWDSQDASRQLLVVDVLYAWGDKQMLMDLYDDSEFIKVKSEIAWALAALKSVAGGSIIAEQVRESWNPDWLALDRTFVHPPEDPRWGRTIAEYLSAEMRRVEAALWDYFHPAFGVLDDERLAVLKIIAADRTIQAGMRFDLLGKDYGGTEWGLPLLEQAARDILAVDSSSSTMQRIISMMKAVGNGGFVLEPALE